MKFFLCITVATLCSGSAVQVRVPEKIRPLPPDDLVPIHCLSREYKYFDSCCCPVIWCPPVLYSRSSLSCLHYSNPSKRCCCPRRHCPTRPTLPPPLPPCPPNPSLSNACNATVYEHPNYVECRELVIKQQNANFVNDLMDNRANSIRIHGSCKWLFYKDPNFSGSSYILNSNTNYPSAFSWKGQADTLSSARVLPPAGTIAIALFEHSYFTGRMVILCRSNSNLHKLEFEDQASSVIVIGGTWKIYDNCTYEGGSRRLTPGNYGRLTQFDDKISSVLC